MEGGSTPLFDRATFYHRRPDRGGSEGASQLAQRGGGQARGLIGKFERPPIGRLENVGVARRGGNYIISMAISIKVLVLPLSSGQSLRGRTIDHLVGA